MGAEDGDHRNLEEAGELGPERLKPPFLPQKYTCPCVIADPGDVSLEINGHPVPERRACPEDPFRGQFCGQIATQEESRLRMRTLVHIELLAEITRAMRDAL